MKRGICPKCGKLKWLTKHSKTGHHLPPFTPICRDCHDEVHGMNPPKPKIHGKYAPGTPKYKKKQK
jgi:hypothetical protein